MKSINFNFVTFGFLNLGVSRKSSIGQAVGRLQNCEAVTSKYKLFLKRGKIIRSEREEVVLALDSDM